MALTPASTLAQVEAEYEANADYDVSASEEKAKAFIVACRYLLRRYPTSIDHASGSGRRAVQRNIEVIREAETKARTWLNEHGSSSASGAGGSGAARHFSFRELRS